MFIVRIQTQYNVDPSYYYAFLRWWELTKKTKQKSISFHSFLFPSFLPTVLLSFSSAIYLGWTPHPHTPFPPPKRKQIWCMRWVSIVIFWWLILFSSFLHSFLLPSFFCLTFSFLSQYSIDQKSRLLLWRIQWTIDVFSPFFYRLPFLHQLATFHFQMCFLWPLPPCHEKFPP